MLYNKQYLLLKKSDGQQYVQAKSFAQPKPATTASAVTNVSPQRTPPTVQDLKKASQTAASASAAANPKPASTSATQQRKRDLR